MGCATDPAETRAVGVEARSSHAHAGEVATLHHWQLAVHVGAAGGTLVPVLGKGGVGKKKSLRKLANTLASGCVSVDARKCTGPC
jgi:hypothetical protein